MEVHFILQRAAGTDSGSHPFYAQWWFWTGVAVLVGATTAAVVIPVESGTNAPLPTSTGVVYQLLTERPRLR